VKLIEKKSNVKEFRGLFVGNPLSFSDTVVKLAEAEIPYFDFIRTASLNEPLFLDDKQAQSIRIIVVDELILDDLIMAMPQLHTKFPQANIALAFRKVENARRLIKLIRETPAIGQVGLLPMDLHVDSWVSVLRLLACGENYMPAELIAVEADVSAAVTAENEAGEVVCLTERELEVLRIAAEGKQNKIIADELNLSQHTVKLHMHHVIAKLGLHNRTEAAIWYLGQNSENKGVSHD